MGDTGVTITRKAKAKPRPFAMGDQPLKTSDLEQLIAYLAKDKIARRAKEAKLVAKRRKELNKKK
jgi:hypothetical protein